MKRLKEGNATVLLPCGMAQVLPQPSQGASLAVEELVVRERSRSSLLPTDWAVKSVAGAVTVGELTGLNRG